MNQEKTINQIKSIKVLILLTPNETWARPHLFLNLYRVFIKHIINSLQEKNLSGILLCQVFFSI